MLRACSRVTLIVAAVLAARALPSFSASPSIVISQVYGGGGNSGASYKNDFIELYNRGTTPVDLAGWAVQYSSAGGTTWEATPLTGTLLPGRYFLIEEAQGAGGTVDLPVPDARGMLALGSSAGKVALTSNSSALAGGCPSGVVDLVGYGGANCSEGSPAPSLSNTTALFRVNGGTTDTDNNAQDFTTGPPNPRNSTGTFPSTNPTITAIVKPAPVTPGGSVLMIATVVPGANPASTGITVSGDLSSLNGPLIQRFYDDGTQGDERAGDLKFSFQYSVPDSLPTGAKPIPVAVIDDQGRKAAAIMTVPVARAAAAEVQANFVFPQFADGGGYVSDFLLTNPTDTATHATLSFFSDSGEPLSIAVDGVNSATKEVFVPARGSTKVSTSGSAASVATGWVRVTSAPFIDLGGNAVFQLYKGRTLFSEASVPGILPVSKIDFFADEDRDFQTGFALANPGSLEANGTIRLLRKDGSEFGVSPIKLPPGSHTAAFLSQVFGSGAPTGRVEISLASGYLAATVLRYHSTSVFSTVSANQSGYVPAGATALFSPNGGVRDRLIAEINKAQSNIDIAIYSFTADATRDALIAARNRGVTIRIIADNSQAEGSGSEITTLEGLGFDLKRMTGIAGGIMHNKFMLLDSRVLFTGSYNWSASAESSNYENALFLTGSTTIQNYKAEFERLWAR